MLISDNIKQFNDIWTSADVLKYFYLPFDLYKHMTGRLRTSSPRKSFLFGKRNIFCVRCKKMLQHDYSQDFFLSFYTGHIECAFSPKTCVIT
jgi:hypothetical protein